MVAIGWILAGAAVVVAILGLGLRLNRKKSTAHLTVRLAEAYRLEGDFETAKRLYEVAPDLDQKLAPAHEGMDRARQGIRQPVIDEALVQAARRRLSEERAAVVDHLSARGIDVELPPIEATAEEPGEQGEAA